MNEDAWALFKEYGIIEKRKKQKSESPPKIFNRYRWRWLSPVANRSLPELCFEETTLGTEPIIKITLNETRSNFSLPGFLKNLDGIS